MRPFLDNPMNHRIHVRLTALQKAKLVKLAKKAKMKLSAYVVKQLGLADKP